MRSFTGLVGRRLLETVHSPARHIGEKVLVVLDACSSSVLVLVQRVTRLYVLPVDLAWASRNTVTISSKSL